MDRARGGHFERIPEEYPQGAWYTYTDKTCDYASAKPSIPLLGLTSMIGKRTAWKIGDEWRLNTEVK